MALIGATLVDPDHAARIDIMVLQMAGKAARQKQHESV